MFDPREARVFLSIDCHSFCYIWRGLNDFGDGPRHDVLLFQTFAHFMIFLKYSQDVSVIQERVRQSQGAKCRQ